MGKKGSWFSAVKKAFSASKDSSDDHLQDTPSHFLSWKDGKQEIIALQEKKSSKERNRWSFRRSSRALQPADRLPSQSGSDIDHLNRVLNGGLHVASDGLTYTSGHTHFEKSYGHGEHPNKQALAVAVATAAAAEAAVAAAQAAAQVAKLTGTSRSGRNNGTPRLSNVTWQQREELAAIRIQTAFRAFLARRTLRTLRGLARLQALAQGQIGQRQTTATMRCMQALVRAQAAVRGRRTTRLFEDDTVGGATLLHPTWEQQKHHQSPGVSEKDHKDQGGHREREWDHSSQTIEQIRARELSKQEAAVKRERSMAYAFSHQQLNVNNHYSNKASMTSQLGWNWLERWMAARPWENRRPSPAKEVATRGVSTPATPPIFSSLPQRQPSPLRRGSAPATPGPPSFRQSATPHTASPGQRAAPVTPIVSSFSAPPARLTSFPGSARTRVHSLASSSLRDDLSVASFSGTPSYMASTESARAKLRSHSTPKQRPSGTRSSATSIHSEDMNGVQQPLARKRLSFANGDSGSARSFLSWRGSSFAPLQRNLSFEGRYTKPNF